MNKLFQRFLSAFVAATILASAPGVSYAQVAPSSLCSGGGYAFMFFNGVQTTEDQAQEGLEAFKKLHGGVTASGEVIRYEKFYNYTKGLEDFVETFEQRLTEQEGLLQNRFELFFSALAGNGPWWSNIIAAVPSLSSIADAIRDLGLAAATSSITSMAGSPQTWRNYQEHRSRLDNLVLEGKKLLMVAHSQGNLFVNQAYGYARQKVAATSVKVVHIAPASPTLNGAWTLADLDLVINGLRLTGTVPDITTAIPGYLLRPAGFNNKKDALGHGLLEIYLNQSIETGPRVKQHINDALASLQSPPIQAQTGFFSATLTWDGYGDVDLHVVEPDSTHVYFNRPIGRAGYLDVDNIIADGPEHYYAACSASSLKEGVYQVGVANYSRAVGRTAVVQIASWVDGTLGTRKVTLGESTGEVPSQLLFNVVVKKNPVTGQFSVTLGD